MRPSSSALLRCSCCSAPSSSSRYPPSPSFSHALNLVSSEPPPFFFFSSPPGCSLPPLSALQRASSQHSPSLVLGSDISSSLDELQNDCMHQVPIWKGENSHLGGGQFWSRSSGYIFSRWIGQIHGQLGSSSCSSSSVLSQQWSTCLFARSMSIKGREDRRRKDLARREFQLLRRRTKLLKATLSLEERLLWRLRKSNRKKAVLLQRLKKYELEEDPEAVHDPELITPEQLQALKKVGYKNRNYVPVGRRGVYGGVVQNMHMHWKFHETVQVDCHIFKREDIRTIARQLAVLSGGIVIDIHQSTTIIMYRGKNYKQPKTEMIPPNTLTKRKALFKSKYLQALEGLDMNIKEIEAQLQTVRRKQKENTAQEAEKDSNKTPQIVGDKVVESSFLTNLSEVSTSDDDDGIFSWESDSLDEEELSDDDESKPKKDEEVHLDRKKTEKPLSWTSGDSAGRGSKTNRRTAKELILAEQELFKNSPQRLADGAQKSGLVSSRDNEFNNNSVDLDDNLSTDGDNDHETGNGIRDGKFQRLESFRAYDKKLSRHTLEVLEVSSTNYDLEGYLDKDISSCNGNKAVKKSEVANRVKGHQQIMNKKIAKFVEDYTTDEDEDDEEFGTDFDNLEDFSESETGPMAGAKSTHRREGGDVK